MNKWIKGLCLLLCLLLLPCMACADQQGSIALNVTVEGKGLAGAEFAVYRVAELVNGASFALLPGYDAGGADVNQLDDAAAWAALAQRLAEQVSGAEQTIITDATGRGKLEGIQTGLYLVAGRKAEIDGWTYDFAPFMMSLPGRIGDGWSYDVQADVKHERVPVLCDIQVVKVWKDEGYTKMRPKSIWVDLYCDGEKAYTAELNAANNWSYVWGGLESAHEWSVQEQAVPEGYKAEYAEQNGALVITNTLVKKPAPPPDIPQTGLTWWPVPVLGILGAALFIVGWAMRRKESNEHEEA